MPLAVLSIDLEARLAKFEQGLGRAVQLTEQQSSRMQGAMNLAGIAATGLGAAVTAGFAALEVTKSIGVLDYLDDLSEKYGIAADKLSAYRYAAEVAGTPTEALAAGLQKLSKNLSEGSGAFALIGVKTKTATGELRDADSVLLDIAEKFQGYEDGVGKAALAQALFGKSGADMIPLLNKGRSGIEALRLEAEKLGAVFGSEMAKQAGDFSDNLKRIELSSQAVKIQIVGSVLPALNDLAVKFLDAKKNGTLLVDVFTAIASFSPAKLLGKQLFADLVDPAPIKAAQAEIERLSGMLIGVENVLKRDPDNTAAQRRLKLLQDKIATHAAQLRLLASAEAAAAPPEPPAAPAKKPPPAIGDKDARAQSDAAFERFMAQISRREQLAQAELDSGEKLRESDRFRIDILAQLDEAENKLDSKRTGRIKDKLTEAVAVLKLNEAQGERQRGINEEVRAFAAVGASREEASRHLVEYIEEIGLNASAVENLRIKRLEDALAIEQQALAQRMLTDEGTFALAVMEQNVRLLEKQIDLRKQARDRAQELAGDPIEGSQRAIDEYLGALQDKGAAAYELTKKLQATFEDDLVSSLMRGKLDVSQTVDFIIAEFLRLQIIKPLIGSLFSMMGGGGASSLFGFADGGVFNAGRVTAFAAGGVFNGPHLFRFAQGGALATGVLGEAGPEAVMPLERGPGGKLGVRASGGHRTAVVINNNQTYNVGQGMSRTEVMSALRLSKQDTIATIQDMFRRKYWGGSGNG